MEAGKNLRCIMGFYKIIFCALIVVNLSSCIGIGEHFGTPKTSIYIGLCLVGAVMGLGSINRMIFKGLESGVIIFFYNWCYTISCWLKSSFFIYNKNGSYNIANSHK